MKVSKCQKDFKIKDLKKISLKNIHLFCYNIQIHKNYSHFL